MLASTQTTYEATYDLKLTDNEIFVKNRSLKRCKFLRIFAKLQWSITQSLFNEMLCNFYTAKTLNQITIPAILVNFDSL